MSTNRRKQALPQGLYAVVDGQELRVFATMGRPGYRLLSYDPRPGFEQDERGVYLREVGPDEVLECVDYRSHGTYRGWDVGVSPNRRGRVVLGLWTNDRRRPETDADADALGFDFREPGVWTKIVEPDDPDLEIVTTRTPVDPPWIKDRDADS